MSEEILARVVSWSSGRERLWDGLVLYGRKTIFRAEERPTEAQARADVIDWCVRMGKKPRWEGGEPAKVFGNANGQAPAAAAAANKPSQGLELAVGPHMLSRNDRQTLAKCHTVIARGLKTSLKVGRALLTVRDERLFRYRFATFEQYVKDRWEMSVRHAHRLCDAAEVVEDLSKGQTAESAESAEKPKPKALPLPANESQARELARLPRVERPRVWAQVVTDAPGGKVTAQAVESAVRKRLAPGPQTAGLPAAKYGDPGEMATLLQADESRKPVDLNIEILLAAGTILSKLRDLEPMVRKQGRPASIGHVVQATVLVRKLAQEYELATRERGNAPLRTEPNRHGSDRSRRKITAAARARLSAIARLRWAKAKAAGGNNLAGKKPGRLTAAGR